MVSLSDAGWPAPRIAARLGYHPQTVCDALRSFLARGTAALRPFRSDRNVQKDYVRLLGRLGSAWTAAKSLKV